MRRLAALRPVDVVELVDAQWTLLRMQRLLRTHPAGELIARATPRDPVEPVEPVEPALDVRADRLATAVARAARYGVFRPKCLVRALSLHQLLERKGVVGSRVRLGVRRDAAGLAAHAWVEYRGRVLADTERHVRAFEPLPDVRPVGAR